MAYLDPLLQAGPTGKYDFVVKNGTLVLTDDQSGPILRLLSQEAWIADNGERDGDSLTSVRMETSTTESKIRGVLESRLRVLLGMNRLESLSIQNVSKSSNKEGSWVFTLQKKRPGGAPEVVQYRVLT